MPFQKGNQLAKLHKQKQSKKTVWIMESLSAHGYDYEKMLVKFLSDAAKGDRHAYAMAELLIKLVPHLAHAPKNDAGVNQIETLVINRFDTVKAQPSIMEGHPPLDTTAELNTPSQSEQM